MTTIRPALGEMRGSIRGDGKRLPIHPADVSGRYTRAREIGFAILIAIYAALPWIPIGGHPAVFLDLERRRFHLFGAAFNAQDTWLLFFILAGAGVLLIAATALLGRIWCGYACPQTVFLEGVFRKVERWIEGPGATRLRRNLAPMSAGKLARKALKHGIFVIFALAVAHVFLSYFVSLPRLFAMMRSSPADHPVAFLWVLGITGVMYFNFAWFREQTCLIVCPYGRLQSALTDADTLIIGYDQRRGEPRGKLKNTGAGDCVDCGRCVAVCPTGIDIRNGLQIECIGCAACIDACDDIMARVGRPAGLIRYDSARGLAGERRRIWRPRLLLYGVLGAGIAVGAAFAFRSHTSFEANLLRAPGMPFSVTDGRVRNSFELHLVNKDASGARFAIAPLTGADVQVTLAQREVELDAGESTSFAIFTEMAQASFRPGTVLRIRITHLDGERPEDVIREARLLGPQR
jgi:cytochrome c oxidase accessory protein FixG